MPSPILKTLLVFCAVLTLVPSSPAKEPEERPTNIVLFLADDLGYADLGSYGAEGFSTPHLDRLAEKGLRFTDFYVAAAVCSASRAALLTGRYPLRTSITGVVSANRKEGIPAEEILISEMLKEQGYATGIFGKWHLGNVPKLWPAANGFDEWFGTIGSNDMGKGRPSLEQRRLGKAGVELVDQDQVVEINPDQRLLTKRYTDRAIDFIKRNQDDPFFVYIPFNMPHTPLFASKDFRNSSERGLYGDVVQEIDASVGRVVQTLETLKLDKNTLVLFTSDNGPWLIFGDHGGSAAPLSGGKKQTLEGGMRVACVAYWPGKIPAGSVVSELVTSMDFLPTIANLAGAPLPKKQLDGDDLTELLFHPKSESPFGADRELPRYLLYYWDEELQAIRVGDWKLRLAHIDTQAPDPDKIGNGGIRGEIHLEERSLALFNLVEDPAERKNLAEEYPEIVESLQNFLTQLRSEGRLPQNLHR
ncbi:C-terminal region of aryl-sulfatase [Planctomycetales bacterium 10988]|nr:C-terminal region of aryl-sulfatase [Planctomycetales bacterium 10988]